MNHLTLNRWYTSDALQSFIAESDEAQLNKRRFCYKHLMGFLLNKGKDICALYGIRRTGKTVLMLQAIRELMDTYHISADKIAYITIGKKNELDDERIVRIIDEMAEEGVRYIFVDEISYIDMELEDNSLNLLADRLAKVGIKIVIAGTFSYAIRLLAKETLFDRMQMIDTTYFSYKEAHDVFGQDLDTFIKYGGIINFDEDGRKMSPYDYMETAIVQNIVQSIFKSDKKYELLLTLPDSTKESKTEKELKALVTKQIRLVLDKYMKLMVYGTLANKKTYRFSDIGNLSDVIRQRSEQEHIVDESLEILNLDKRTYYKILANNVGNSEEVSEETFKILGKIFDEIGIKKEIFLDDGTITVFIPNYLRYGLCDMIMKLVGQQVREETNSRYDSELAGEILMGSIQEAICYLDLKVVNNIDFDMYRSSDGSAEIDLIIRNKKDGWIDLYELKHSSVRTEEQVKHLVNKDFIRDVEQAMKCKVRTHYVLYNGENATMSYHPVQVFSNLEQKAIDMKKTNAAEKWERLVEQAQTQNWEPVEVIYRNMEDFLCSLQIVR